MDQKSAIAKEKKRIEEQIEKSFAFLAPHSIPDYLVKMVKLRVKHIAIQSYLNGISDVFTSQLADMERERKEREARNVQRN